MTEYWKSTPRYWCKHCSVYVRDTKLERSNHENTAKHQGALKRFIRELHRGHEREEREKDRAKREIERLNGAVGASSSSTSAAGPSSAPGRRPPIPTPSSSTPGQGTAEQRHKQWEQLVEMGVEVPEELRGDMAMAGEWSVTSTRIINDKKDDPEKVEAVAIGVRKRPKEEGEDEEAEAINGLFKKRAKWGRDTKQAPEDDAELDALLSGSLVPKAKKEEEDKTSAEDTVKKEEPSSPKIKKEEPADDEAPTLADAEAATTKDGAESPPVKTEEGAAEEAAPAVFFKKRKPKDARQKKAMKT